MRKLSLTLVSVFAIFTLIAQPLTPPQRFYPQRTLPNQFRDFVDHQQRLSFEKPEIKKENGKVIITMSEAHFNKMKEMRMRQRNSMRHASFRTQHCEKCEKPHKKHMKKRLQNSRQRF